MPQTRSVSGVRSPAVKWISPSSSSCNRLPRATRRARRPFRPLYEGLPAGTMITLRGEKGTQRPLPDRTLPCQPVAATADRRGGRLVMSATDQMRLKVGCFPLQAHSWQIYGSGRAEYPSRSRYDRYSRNMRVYASRMRATPPTTSSLLETYAPRRWRELRLNPAIGHVTDF
jgi:hypothetical protein